MPPDGGTCATRFSISKLEGTVASDISVAPRSIPLHSPTSTRSCVDYHFQLSRPFLDEWLQNICAQECGHSKERPGAAFLTYTHGRSRVSKSFPSGYAVTLFFNFNMDVIVPHKLNDPGSMAEARPLQWKARLKSAIADTPDCSDPRNLSCCPNLVAPSVSRL